MQPSSLYPILGHPTGDANGFNYCLVEYSGRSACHRTALFIATGAGAVHAAGERGEPASGHRPIKVCVQSRRLAPLGCSLYVFARGASPGGSKGIGLRSWNMPFRLATLPGAGYNPMAFFLNVVRDFKKKDYKMVISEELSGKIIEDVMLAASERSHLRIEGASVVGPISSWRIAVLREGPDAWEDWRELQEFLESIAKKYK